MALKVEGGSEKWKDVVVFSWCRLWVTLTLTTRGQGLLCRASNFEAIPQLLSVKNSEERGPWRGHLLQTEPCHLPCSHHPETFCSHRKIQHWSIGIPRGYLVMLEDVFRCPKWTLLLLASSSVAWYPCKAAPYKELSGRNVSDAKRETLWSN